MTFVKSTALIITCVNMCFVASAPCQSNQKTASSNLPSLDAQTVLTNCANYFQHIPPIAFTYKSEFWRGGPEVTTEKADVSFVGTFAYADPCFFFEKKWTGNSVKAASKAGEPILMAYNGDNYQLRTGDMEYCVTKDPSKISTAVYDLPLWEPFIFGFETHSVNPLVELSSVQHWLDVGRTCRPLGSLDDTQNIIQMKFDRKVKGGNTVPYTVQLSSALGFLPVSFSVENQLSGDVCQLTVDKYRILTSKAGSFVLPTLIKTKVTDKDGKITREHEIIEVDEASIRLDQDVHREQFSLDPSQANTLHDLDLGALIHLK